MIPWQSLATIPEGQAGQVRRKHVRDDRPSIPLSHSLPIPISLITDTMAGKAGLYAGTTSKQA